MKSDNQITSNALKPLAIMPQGLDNQFVPNDHLHKIINSKGKLSRKSIRKEINHSINAEFIRSLIFGEQLVLNRAYMINTPEIYKYFLPSSEERETFIDLMESKSIIPWLFNESSIDQKPIYEVDPKGWGAVCKLIEDFNEIPSLRFSWDDDENNRYLNNLTLSFTNYILSMPSVADKIAKDFCENNFGVSKETESDFRNKIGEVSKYVVDEIGSSDKPYITRSKLYETFVCIDGSNITDGFYDGEKSFSLPLKLLFDLKYQVNLPTAFNIQSLTSWDLPSRTTLHELDMALNDHENSVNLNIAELIGNLSFAKIQQHYWFNSINRLSLSDIKTARESDEWKELMAVSSEINQQSKIAVITGNVSKSLDFAKFWDAYIAYQEKLSGIVKATLLEEIQPQAFIQVRMGEILFRIDPINRNAIIGGNANSLMNRNTPFETGIIVGGQGKNKIDLSYIFDFLRTRILGARDQFEILHKHLLDDGYKIDKSKYIAPSKESSITDSADFFGYRRA